MAELPGAISIKPHTMNAEESDAGPGKMLHNLLFLKSKINFVKHVSVVTHYVEINFAFQIFLVVSPLM